MTAEEFIREHLYITKDDVEDVHDSLGAVENILIEFAKIHVKKALEAANLLSEYEFDERARDLVDNKNFILNAYPENLIQ